MRAKLAISMLLVLNWFLFYKMTFVIVPLQIENQKQIRIEQLIRRFKISEKIADSFYEIGKETHLDPLLLCSLAKTESGFRLDAVSPKDYKGILQTPEATMRWADVDILIGARILKEKLSISKGDLLKALQLYKGGNNMEALKEAKAVMKIYEVCRRD